MIEVNFDGLVGPTHIYGGLSFGNIASITNAGMVANPRLAAKQGLQKMRLLMDLGIPQALIPPHQRPNFALLRTLGFSGDPIHMLQQAHKANPALLYAVYSAASMWTANMATVSPSCDTLDHKVHITPANLTFNLHRAQEAEFSYDLLRKIFKDPNYFTIHPPLPSDGDVSDEGAANHSIVCKDYGIKGLELFVYGRQSLDKNESSKTKYPGRQTMLASEAVAQTHVLDMQNVIFLQQSREAIDAGVFHNDVVFVGNKNVILMHEQAFVDWSQAKTKIKSFLNNDCHFIIISHKQLSLQKAVATYLFNSQIVSVDAHNMVLIAPYECKEDRDTMQIIQHIVDGNNPINKVEFVQCRQSMLNGGGPACLRLRVVLSKEEQAACLQSVFLNADLCNKLEGWIDKNYRDRLDAQDLLDPQLYLEVQSALDELTHILGLGSIYPFQQA